MKVLLIIPTVPDQYNGLVQTTVNLIINLKKSFGVNSIVLGQSNLKKYFIENGAQQYIEYDTSKVNINLLVKLPIIVKNNQVDVIIGANASSDIHLLLIKSIPIVYIIRGSYFTEYKKAKLLSKLKMLIYFFLLKRKNSHVVFQSKQAKMDIKKLWFLRKGFSNYTIIPTGIDNNKFHEKSIIPLSSNEIKIIISGRLSSEKRTELAIKACKKLMESNLKFKIDIYGDGSDKSKIIDMIDQYNLNEYISLEGSRDSMHLIYPNYHVMWHFCRHESFSRSILEALACGVPVIAYPGGGNLDILEDNVNGFFFDPNNEVSSIVELTQNLVTNEKLYNRLSQNASLLIRKKYSFNKYINQFYRLLESLKNN